MLARLGDGSKEAEGMRSLDLRPGSRAGKHHRNVTALPGDGRESAPTLMVVPQNRAVPGGDDHEDHGMRGGTHRGPNRAGGTWQPWSPRRRYARHLTGIDQVYAVMGGFHLGGPLFEPLIPRVCAALELLWPALIVPAHCTGWSAQRPRRAVPGRVHPEYRRHPVPALDHGHGRRIAEVVHPELAEPRLPAQYLQPQPE